MLWTRRGSCAVAAPWQKHLPASLWHRPILSLTKHPAHLQLQSHYKYAGRQWLPKLLACFPALTSLSLPSHQASPADVACLSSARCAATLHKLTIAPALCSLHAALQQLTNLPALRDLELRLIFRRTHDSDSESDSGSESEPEQETETERPLPRVDVSPLGALSQLQRLSMVTDSCCFTAGDLHALAARCTQLTHLHLHQDLNDGRFTIDAPSPSSSGAAAPFSCTWPSIQHLSVQEFQPGEVTALLGAVFHHCPRLKSTAVSLGLGAVPPRPDQAPSLPNHPSSAAALKELCQRLAERPGHVQRLEFWWPYPLQQIYQHSIVPVNDMFAALAPLRDRIVSVAVRHYRLDRGDVAALAAAVGQGRLQELDLKTCAGPVEIVTTEALMGFPRMTNLWLPEPSEDAGWEDAMLQVCISAQTDSHRAACLLLEYDSSRSFGAWDGFAEAWAAMPQPQTGRVAVELIDRGL